MTIPYDYYRIFYFVGTYHSFTRAAQVLGSSQPNVTRAMNRLEQELDCRLFVRSHRGVTLTPEGEKLYLHASAAFAQLQTAEAELAGERVLEAGQITVGVTEIALHLLLMPLLSGFRKTYPGIRIRVLSASTPQTIRASAQGLVDLALATSPAEINSPLTAASLRGFQDVLLAGTAFSALRGKPISIENLTDYPLICLGRDSMTFRFYDKLFSDSGAVLEPDVEAATADQILPMVENGLGLGFLPYEMARQALADGHVFQVELKESVPERRILLIRDKNRPLCAAARALTEWLQTGN